MMHQSLRHFDAALLAAREELNSIIRPVIQPDPRQHLLNAITKRPAA